MYFVIQKNKEWNWLGKPTTETVLCDIQASNTNITQSILGWGESITNLLKEIQEIINEIWDNCHLKLVYSGIPINTQFLAATKQLYEWSSPSVCLSVCPSVCHTFLTMFPSLYHHEIFRSYYQWQTWRPCKRSKSEFKGQGHRGQHQT